MTKQRHPSFQAYMDEFNQQMQINCGINAIARMQEEVAICYQRGLTMDECLNHVDMQCGLSEMYLKPEREARSGSGSHGLPKQAV